MGGIDVNLRRVAPAAVIVLAVVATGCGSDKKSSSTSASQTPSGPKIGVTFTKPKPREKLGTTVTATVHLTNFKLDPKAVGKPPQPGKGHVHFSMDGGKFDYPKYSGANGVLAKKLGVTGKYSPSVTPTIKYKGLPKGKHTISVQLANNDHSNAGASAKVSFKVK
jgi:hypothetical protein